VGASKNLDAGADLREDDIAGDSSDERAALIVITEREGGRRDIERVGDVLEVGGCWTHGRQAVDRFVESTQIPRHNTERVTGVTKLHVALAEAVRYDVVGTVSQNGATSCATRAPDNRQIAGPIVCLIEQHATVVVRSRAAGA